MIEKDDIYPGEIAERSAQEHFEDNTTMSAAIYPKRELLSKC